MIEWYLEVQRGDEDLHLIHELKEFRDYSVGRQRHFDIVSCNPLVSRNHGLFKHKTNNKIYVRDTNSSNGVWVNDQQIKPGCDHLLNENDLIGIGSPSTATEARLELFRLRGRQLIVDSDDIPEFKPKNEIIDKENNPPSLANVDVPTGNEKLSSSSPKVSGNEEANRCQTSNGISSIGVKQPNGPNKTEYLVNSAETNSASSSAVPVVGGDINSGHQLRGVDKHECPATSYEIPTHSENNGEHIYSFVEDESEPVIAKFEHSLKLSRAADSASKTYDIVNVDEEQPDARDAKVSQDNSADNKSVAKAMPHKDYLEKVAVVRLKRLELSTPAPANQPATVSGKPKKKFEAISPSSSDDDTVSVDTNTKTKQNRRSSNTTSAKESPDTLRHLRKSVALDKTSKAPRPLKSLSAKQSSEHSVRGKHGVARKSDESNAKPKKTVIESRTSEKPKRKISLCEELFGRSNSPDGDSDESSSNERWRIASARVKSKSSERLSKSRDKQVGTSTRRQRRISSDSSTSTPISSSDRSSQSKAKQNGHSTRRQRRISSNSSTSTPISSSDRSAQSKAKQNGHSTRRHSRMSSDSSRDKPSPIERTNVREKEMQTNQLTKHSTDKPAALERSDAKELQLKTEVTDARNDPVSLDSVHSIRSQENEVSVGLSISKDLFPEVTRTIKQEHLESIVQAAQDVQQQARTSQAVAAPTVDQVRSIKQEILRADQPSTSAVSVTRELDIPSPVSLQGNQEVAAGNSFSTSCDIGEIICLSDDDDIFPKSQMFNDDIEVKDEPLPLYDEACTDIQIKAERHSQREAERLGAENEDNIFGIIKGDVEFDDAAIIIDDDADEELDSLWYSRLSQPGYTSSQLGPSQERFDDKRIISIRTGTNVSSFLDDNDLITNERNEAAPAAQDDSVPICVVVHSMSPALYRAAQAATVTDEPDQPAQVDEQSSSKNADKSARKSYVKPPVIEPPHLVKGRRKTTEEVKPKEPQKRARKRKPTVDERPAAAVATVRTFGTGTNLDKSVINELHKRHKRRRPSSDTLPRTKKQEIREERMKKLKEIAQKTADDKKQDDKPKSTPKPYIKVSTSRGLFLTDKEPAQEKEKRKVRGKTPSELEPKPKKQFTIPKKQPEGLDEVNQLAGPSTSKADTTHPMPSTVGENENVITAEKLTKKRVTFNDKPQIREYIIDDGNNMNKCTSKDAPLPRKVIQTLPPTRVADDLAENLALCDILSWVPIWLEEQRTTNAAPKLSMHKPIQMLHTFNTHGDYCNIVVPLLLLELWRSVYKDWISTRNPVMLACIDEVQPLHICRMNMLALHCHCVITRVDSEQHLHPGRGDLLVCEILLGDGHRQCAVIKKLGYVVAINKRRLNNNDLINTKLLFSDAIPEFLVHLKIMLKDFNTEINRDRLIRIRAISRIGPSLRIFKSVALLKQSALCKFILNPLVKDYKLPKLTEMKLVISDKLDADQLTCMIEACQICARPEPGIYMVQGPPGTGKSRVIKNIVQQLIYGERRVGTKPHCILLCAPSNGAIDELVRKLLEMRQSLPQKKRFRMVRLGPPNSIHPKVKPVSLPCLAEAFVQKQLNLKLEAKDAVVNDLHFRQSKINMLENKLVSLRGRQLDTIEVEMQLHKAKNDMKLFHNRNKKELTHDERKMLERDSEETVISKADIVCTTLSSCVGSRMEEMYHKNLLRFTCCIVDEATQSSEQETLIPLMLGINKLVLIGDPAQLPATVLSQEAKQLGYGNSLFYRIQQCVEHLAENPIRMLRSQYRMHPEICKFPNEHFYCGKLITSSAFIDNRDANGGCTFRRRYRVFALNAPYIHQQPYSAYLNVPEAQFVLVLVKLVMARTGYSVGIITPYTKQREYLQWALQQMITKETAKEHDRVTVNTVDGFQGQERDVIIISCVRHSSNMFLADQQRLNVSLTRAKHALFICASTKLFTNDDIWRKLEQDATKRHCLEVLSKTEYENEQYVTSLLYNS